MFGEIFSRSAIASRFNPRHASRATCRCRGVSSSAFASRRHSVSLNNSGNAPSWYEDHTIVGSKGAFYLRQGLGLIHQDAKGKEVKVRLPKYTKNPDSNFVDVIYGKDKPQVPPICGLRVIEVTEAAWKSAASGKPVKVPK